MDILEMGGFNGFSRTKRKERSWQALEFKDGKFSDVSEASQMHMIDTNKILPNANQPRQSFDNDAIVSLANSIRNHGIIQPITVRKSLKSGENSDFFEVIAGERRLKAAKLLDVRKIPCIVVEADERQSAEMSIIENTQREDLNFFDEATVIATLIRSHGLTQDEAAHRLCVSQSYIANKLRILRLNVEERTLIQKYDLSERHARALLRLSTAEERLRTIEYIRTHDLNVAAAEAYIDRYISGKLTKSAKSASNRLVLKDIRVFYNSVNRAISTMKQAGINVESERVEENGVTVLTIRIPSNVSRETSKQPE